MDSQGTRATKMRGQKSQCGKAKTISTALKRVFKWGMEFFLFDIISEGSSFAYMRYAL